MKRKNENPREIRQKFEHVNRLERKAQRYACWETHGYAEQSSGYASCARICASRLKIKSTHLPADAVLLSRGELSEKIRCTTVGCTLCGSSKHEKARRTEGTRVREFDTKNTSIVQRLLEASFVHRLVQKK
jgi:hypothetical protein